MNARLAGARAGGKQVVNSGWPPANFNATAEVPNDRYKDNDQPAQRPTPNKPTTSPQVQQIAGKLANEAMASCHQDRVMLRGYACDCIQLSIHDYLAHHAAETLSNPPTAASLLAGRAFQPEKCITDPPAKTLAHNEAFAAGLKQPAAQDCASEKFVAALHANPIPSQAQAQLSSAIKACR